MTDYYWYAIDPVDILLMRESKPFSPAEGSWAKGMFPPMPSTVFQALRSLTAWQNDEDDRTARNLQFLGPFLVQEVGSELVLWLPTPKDLLAAYLNPDETDLEEARNYKEANPGWEKLERLQPLDANYPGGEFFGFSPTQYAASELAPMVPPAENQGYGKVYAWMKSSALKHYLEGNLSAITAQDFWTDGDPWGLQVLPHIQVEMGTRQVKSEDGYFTEVAVRMRSGWKLVAGLTVQLETAAVRLGGEGHRALVEPLNDFQPWKELEDFLQPLNSDSDTAYLLTPGLAHVDVPDRAVFGLYPSSWKEYLRGCVGDRPLLWGGMSTFQKRRESDGKAHPKETAFAPQRAYVPPGTVYRFKKGAGLNESLRRPLLPIGNANWLQTLQTLGYGTLLWNRAK